MRIAVISDIHANLVALTRALEAIDELQPDAIYCLGDVTGYGPDPEACVQIIRSRADVCLAGNHDLAVTGALELGHFNPVAREAILWHRAHLSQESLDWLASLPSRLDLPDLTLAHGSPRHPIWEYVADADTAADNADAFDAPVCLIGHSHLALAWRLHQTSGRVRASLETQAPGVPLTLDLRDKWLLNPGSVGQPRDHDPRAAFAMLDTARWQWVWHRLAYDIERVERAIVAAGLPEMLGTRLYLGW